MIAMAGLIHRICRLLARIPLMDRGYPWFGRRFRPLDLILPRGEVESVIRGQPFLIRPRIMQQHKYWYLLESFGDPVEDRMLELFCDLIEEGETVADVGSNAGLYAIVAAGKLGTTGSVIAFEPNPYNVRWLRRNIEAGGHENVEIMQTAIGDSIGTARLWIARLSGEHTLLGSSIEEDGSIEVPVTTIDSIVAEVGDLDVMKIDVEGAEMMVLEGARESLREHRCKKILCEVHPRHLGTIGVTIGSLLSPLLDNSYTVFGLTQGARTQRIVDVSTDRDIKALIAIASDTWDERVQSLLEAEVA
jgi:FkbM family methyltransferase